MVVMWGYKSPNKCYKYSYLTYDPTLIRTSKWGSKPYNPPEPDHIFDPKPQTRNPRFLLVRHPKP